jgi:type I restriction enzyme M protein
LQPALDQIAALEASLAPYEKIKSELSAARSRFRDLTDDFVSELKNRCGFMGSDKKRALVLELFAQDVQTGLDAAVSEKRQILVRFVEELWDKYRVPLGQLRCDRKKFEETVNAVLKGMSYS